MAILSTSYRQIANKNHVDHTRITHQEHLNELESKKQECINTEMKYNETPIDIEMDKPAMTTNTRTLDSAPIYSRLPIASPLKYSFPSATAIARPTTSFTFGTFSQNSSGTTSTTASYSRKRKVSECIDWDSVKRQKSCGAEVASRMIEMDTPMEM